jgi:hypothetical protein
MINQEKRDTDENKKHPHVKIKYLRILYRSYSVGARGILIYYII